MDDFSSACENLWEQIKPLYQQLHAYVRRKLMDSYPKNRRDFPNTNHIPAHILGESSHLKGKSFYLAGELVYFTVEPRSSASFNLIAHLQFNNSHLGITNCLNKKRKVR